MRLTEAQLESLSKHKYSVGGQSTIERYFLSPACNWLVELFPVWLAPNIITFIGGVFVLLPGVLLVIATPTASQQDEVSRLCLALVAICQFIYQLLDCIDGKQARRTRTSSPLGEYLDHGIDAFAGVLLPLTVSSAVNLGETPHLHALSMLCALSLFFLAHCHSYLSGTVHVNQWVDVEEARTYFAGLTLAAAICPGGRGSFSTKIPIPFWPHYIPVRDLLFSVPGVFVVIGAISCVSRCVSLISQRKPSQRLQLLGPFFQLAMWLVSSGLLCVLSPIFQTHPQLVLATQGLVAVQLIHQLLVLNICKFPVSFWHPVLMIPPVLLTNGLLSIVPEFHLYIFVFGALLLHLTIWSASIIRQMLDHLQINLLSIPHSTSS